MISGFSAENAEASKMRHASAVRMACSVRYFTKQQNCRLEYAGGLMCGGH
jgi:hypothetical protein